MASDTVKKVQDKLFRKTSGEDKDGVDKTPTMPSESRSSDNNLFIQIPKHTLPNIVTPAIPPPKSKLTKPSSGSPNAEGDGEEYRPYRDRLLEKLGHDFKGVEKYRLQQDEKRDRHWKRWGPYLSDRQWVRFAMVLVCRYEV